MRKLLTACALVAIASGAAHAASGRVDRIHPGEDCYKFTLVNHTSDANGKLVPQEEVYGILDTDLHAEDLKREVSQAYWHGGYITIGETPARQCGSSFIHGIKALWAPADPRYGWETPGTQP